MTERLIKIGFAVLALFAVVFGFMRLGQNIKLTFSSNGEEEAQKSGDEILEETKLKIIDTDEDGLNDWDEINAYGTSPYLTDSDSDGVNDTDEIKRGTDPNCPAGKECGTPLNGATPGSKGASSADAATSADKDIGLPVEELKNLSAAEIKELLKQGGATDEQLQRITDEQLKQLLDETLNQQ